MTIWLIPLMQDFMQSVKGGSVCVCVCVCGGGGGSELHWFLQLLMHMAYIYKYPWPKRQRFLSSAACEPDGSAQAWHCLSLQHSSA